MLESISDSTQSAVDMALRILGEGVRRIAGLLDSE